MALNPKEVEELHHSLKNLLGIWMHIKLAIQKAFGKGAITKAQEEAFLNLKSNLSRLYRVVGDRLPKDIQFGGDEMIDIMKNATTMEHLHSLPLAEKRNVFSQWHKIYILMMRSFGALEVINEGYYPRLHRGLLESAAKGKGSKKKGKGKKKR